MDEYISVEQYAKKHGKAVSLVRNYCQCGRINAIKIGGRWVIPADEPYPRDKRDIRKEKAKAYKYTKELTDDVMSTIGTYMDDEIREALHIKLAPCSNKKFLNAYIKKDPNFVDLLRNEFGYIFRDED